MRGPPLAPDQDMLAAELSAYLDGELTPERARAVEERLAESPAARQLLEELRGVTDQLAALPRHRAPDELAAALQRAAEQQLPRGASPPLRRLRTLRLLARLTVSAAALAACVLIGYQLAQPPRVAPLSRAVAPRRELPGTPAAASRGERAAPDTAAESPWALDSVAAPADRVSPATASEVRDRSALPAGTPVAAVPPPAPEAARAAGGRLSGAASTVDALTADGRATAPPAAPAVQVWVQARDAAEYAAAHAVLADWNRDDLEDHDRAAVKPRTDATQFEYRIAAGDISQRLKALTTAVHDPQQVQVELRFAAADSHILAQAAAGALVAAADQQVAPSASVANRVFVLRDAPQSLGAELKHDEPPATAPTRVAEAEPASSAPTQVAAEPGPPAAPPAVAAAPRPPPTPAPAAASPAPPAKAARAREAEAKKGVRPAQQDSPAPSAETARRPKAKSARAEPSVEVTDAAKPAPPTTAPVATERIAATSAPAMPPGTEADETTAPWSLSAELTDLLGRVLLGGCAPSGAADAASSRPAHSTITLRVHVLPPQPTSAPTSQSQPE
jgi:hypothetical protein